MKPTTNNFASVLYDSIKDAVTQFSTSHKEEHLSDLYIYFNEEEMTLSFYDDVERLLHTITVETIMDKEQAVYEELKNTLKLNFHKLEKEKYFDADYIFKPFAANLVDEHFMVLEELIFIDDETLKLDNDLLVGLDDELNDFLKKLME